MCDVTSPLHLFKPSAANVLCAKTFLKHSWPDLVPGITSLLEVRLGGDCHHLDALLLVPYAAGWFFFNLSHTNGQFSPSDPKQQASLEASSKQKEEACREAERRRVEVELRLVEVKESLKKVESGPFTLGTTLDSSLQDTPVVCALPVAPATDLHAQLLCVSTPCPFFQPQVKTPTLPAPQTASATPSSTSSPMSSSSSLSHCQGNNTTDVSLPVNSASAIKNKPPSIKASKGKVLQKAKVNLQMQYFQVTCTGGGPRRSLILSKPCFFHRSGRRRAPPRGRPKCLSSLSNASSEDQTVLWAPSSLLLITTSANQRLPSNAAG